MDENTQKQSALREVFDIVFIFVLAFVCLVVPTEIQGSVLVGWSETGSIVFLWDPVGYFSLLAGILLFFVVMLYHSVSHYKF
ncbi:AcrB/AcrD/AcrF family protein [Methanolobus sp. ZRKC4]|uniref:AcrB/AcrD/AcrF family protein n=1 Tax=Methanolobus sp. ZRKC4 TaxID=3125787 RepID=UPI00325576C0